MTRATVETEPAVAVDAPSLELIGQLAILKHRLELIGADLTELPQNLAMWTRDPGNAAELPLRQAWARPDAAISEAVAELTDLMHQLIAIRDGE